MLLTVLLGGVLAGCSDEVGGSGDTGFVSGKGVITRLAAADREPPGTDSTETAPPYRRASLLTTFQAASHRTRTASQKAAPGLPA